MASVPLIDGSGSTRLLRTGYTNKKVLCGALFRSTEYTLVQGTASPNTVAPRSRVLGHPTFSPPLWTKPRHGLSWLSLLHLSLPLTSEHCYSVVLITSAGRYRNCDSARQWHCHCPSPYSRHCYRGQRRIFQRQPGHFGVSHRRLLQTRAPHWSECDSRGRDMSEPLPQ